MREKKYKIQVPNKEFYIVVERKKVAVGAEKHIVFVAKTEGLRNRKLFASGLSHRLAYYNMLKVLIDIETTRVLKKLGLKELAS